jgi:hypothetical protein
VRSSSPSGSSPSTSATQLPPSQGRAGPARGARWLLLLIVSFGSVHVLFMLGVEGLRFARAETAITRLEREVAELEREAAGLGAIIEHGDDERYREQLARRQGYMYPDEVRVVTTDRR